MGLLLFLLLFVGFFFFSFLRSVTSLLGALVVTAMAVVDMAGNWGARSTLTGWTGRRAPLEPHPDFAHPDLAHAGLNAPAP